MAAHLGWRRVPLGAALALTALSTSGCAYGGDMPKCVGNVKELKFGCTASHSLAEQICCHNADYAEPSGFFRTVGGHGGLFSQLDRSGVTTFYDSVCGKPLFRAPVGRSFDDWKAESEHHGWPSFRPQEVVKENVMELAGGEVRSACGAHLGHNIPDFSGDRYCIDLVCIAGSAAGGGARLVPLME
mmetsp:Transcript_8868/g.23768  ORF Transcript_8868/g.23768 Transcript_8868/m.23768 type:complete len:186 (-) Transcript_8868:64-621(-)